jgi:hypothetical protein
MPLVPEAYDPYDRTHWEKGPWDKEPDRYYWRDETTKLPCLARRGTQGSWCGYVAVMPDHPWYGVKYSECPHGEDEWCEHRPEHLVDVHGGLTYSDFCTDDKEDGICHVPEEGEPEKVWWFGFDCAHFDDYMPAMEARLKLLHEERPDLEPPELLEISGLRVSYKTLEFVKAEVTHLASQLSKIKGRGGSVALEPHESR